MLSRVANSIYWVNRYIERAENYARFMGVNFSLALDLPPEVPPQWEPLIITMAEEKGFRELYDTPTRENVVLYMTFDTRNPNSILSCLWAARENARSVRESISREMWEHLNQLYLRVKDTAASRNRDLNELQDFFTEIKMGSQLFFGIVDSTITRNEGWHFGRVGRFLERADKTSRFVDVKYFILLPDPAGVGSPIDLLQWTAVLKSASAYNMYRQEYGVITPSHIVEFLFLDKKFPRSVIHCLRQAETSLYEISGTSLTSRYSNPAEKKLSKLCSQFEFVDVKEIFDMGLHQFIDLFQTRNNEVASEIHNTFFALKPVEEGVKAES
jgi:uncharacterized alpha-E superfamily protein